MRHGSTPKRHGAEARVDVPTRRCAVVGSGLRAERGSRASLVTTAEETTGGLSESSSGGVLGPEHHHHVACRAFGIPA